MNLEGRRRVKRMAKISIEISFKREGRSGTRIIHIVAGKPPAVRK